MLGPAGLVFLYEAPCIAMKLSAVAARTSTGLNNTFASLHSRNYRLWFVGQLISLAGTWMQTTAQGYLVFELTKSPAFLGYVGFAAGLPAWVFTLYGGVVADRFSRRNVLVAAQSALMVLAFVLAWLVYTGQVQPWQIIAIALAGGVANAFDAPARQAFVVDMVERRDLTNAIALNSTMFNAAAVIGPALAGVVYAVFGPVWCFTINGLSYVAVIVALLLMKLKPVVAKPSLTSTGTQLKEGLRYTASQGLIRTLILNMGVISLFGMSLMTLLPAWSVQVLGGDVRTNGLLLSARGLGALSGALMVAALGRRPVRGKIWTTGSFVLADCDDGLHGSALDSPVVGADGSGRLGLHVGGQHVQCAHSNKRSGRAARARDEPLHADFLRGYAAGRVAGGRPGRADRRAAHRVPERTNRARRLPTDLVPSPLRPQAGITQTLLGPVSDRARFILVLGLGLRPSPFTFDERNGLVGDRPEHRAAERARSETGPSSVHIKSAALAFNSTCSTDLQPGMTQVTAGC